MAQFTKQFMTDGKFDYKKLMEHREQMQLDPLTEEPDNETYTKEVKTAEAKSQGKGKKAEVAKPSVQAVKIETGELPEKVQETMEVYNADAINGVRVETVTEEKKWIAGAIKKPGALHKALHVPAEKKIPAGKLEKAAEAPGKMGKRARLAMTLKKLRKEQLERVSESELQEDVELDEMVTRKHFQQVADVIKAHPDAEKRAELAKHHAEIFKKQNPRFDHKRFYAAANVPMHEEVEQIDELEKSTLSRYIGKAQMDVDAQKESKRSSELKAKSHDPSSIMGKHHKIVARRQQEKIEKRETGIKKAAQRLAKEEVEQIEERELTPAEAKKKEELVMSMKKKMPSFKERYGKRAKEILYATATKMAKKD